MRLPTLLVLLATMGACRHAPPPPSPWGPAHQPAPPLLLVETPVKTAASFDALFDGLQLVGGSQDVVALLEQAATKVSRAELAASTGARQLVAQAVVRLVQISGPGDKFEVIRTLVDNLHAAAPDAPETLFSRAFLRWVLVSDGRGGLELGNVDRSIVLDLQRDLRRLVDGFPTFAGPAGFDPARLRSTLAAVDAAIAGLPAEATPAAVPAEESPVSAPAAVTPASTP